MEMRSGAGPDPLPCLGASALLLRNPHVCSPPAAGEHTGSCRAGGLASAPGPGVRGPSGLRQAPALRGEAATQTGRVGPARGWAPAGVDVPQVAAAGFSEDICDDNTREAVGRTRQGIPGRPVFCCLLGPLLVTVPSIAGGVFKAYKGVL